APRRRRGLYVSRSSCPCRCPWCAVAQYGSSCPSRWYASVTDNRLMTNSPPAHPSQGGASAASADDLFQNAVEAVENGIENFATGSPKRITSALRSLYAGILLLLKEKLRRLSPPGSGEVLLYKKHKLTKNAGGNVVLVPVGRNTVDLDEIQQRLDDLG